MRFLVLVLVLSLAAFTAHAVSYSNDSDSIDIDYSGGSPAVPDDTGDDGGEGAPQQDGTGAQGNPGGDDGDSFDEESPDVTVSVSATGEDGEAISNLSEDDLVNTLIGNQALLFGGGNGGDSIRLSAEKLRAALKARGVGKLELEDLLGRRFQSKKDFALVAASSVLENEAIQDIQLTLHSLSLTYRAEGRLFAVFPLSYPVKLDIDPRAATREGRVIVTFPWYRFFLQTFVSRSELQTLIDSAMEPIAQGEQDSVHAKTSLLLAVTNAIESRFDTVQGSLK
jgi:hypothetical protein